MVLVSWPSARSDRAETPWIRTEPDPDALHAMRSSSRARCESDKRMRKDEGVALIAGRPSESGGERWCDHNDEELCPCSFFLVRKALKK
jgi:hypothetical protein